MELNHNTRQSLQTAMDNENHLSLSDYCSGSDSETDKARFHSASDSDTAKRDFTPPAGSPARSSISSDQISLPHESLTLEDNNKPSASSPPQKSPVSAKSPIPEPVVYRNIREPPASISTDQIWLPHESLTVEDNKPSAAPTDYSTEKSPSPEVVVKRSVKEEKLAVTTADPVVTDGDGNGGNRRRKLRPPLSILRKTKRDEMVKRAALGFRIFGFMFCLVSFSVMAADKNQGWALDSFQRYMEFRYCISVNVIGFAYSGAQAFDLAYQSVTGKNIVQHHLRYFFDFAFDQIVTYLLISASSSAATRVDDWQLNWGKDKFPDMASASVVMSFLAFAALAFSSLISGYVLCNSKSS